MSPEALVLAYGYPLLFIGIIFEGETFLLIGAFLAHRGYLNLPIVMAVAFASTVLTDQTFFWIGRTRGMTILTRHPEWESRVDKVRRLLEKYQLSLIVTFRFLYGLRILTPLVIGASGFSPRLFLLFNLIGAVIWVVSIGLAGYAFGHAMEIILADIHKYELWIVIGIFVIGTASIIGFWIINRLKRESLAKSQAK
jgi:membrane protein DedA with SNARE-associated domain